MSGHGHVIPNKDGVLARCGGPFFCCVCAKEQAELFASSVFNRDDSEAEQDRLEEAYLTYEDKKMHEINGMILSEELPSEINFRGTKFVLKKMTQECDADKDNILHMNLTYFAVKDAPSKAEELRVHTVVRGGITPGSPCDNK